MSKILFLISVLKLLKFQVRKRSTWIWRLRNKTKKRSKTSARDTLSKNYSKSFPNQSHLRSTAWIMSRKHYYYFWLEE